MYLQDFISDVLGVSDELVEADVVVDDNQGPILVLDQVLLGALRDQRQTVPPGVDFIKQFRPEFTDKTFIGSITSL
jgi:hypothetical protein